MPTVVATSITLDGLEPAAHLHLPDDHNERRRSTGARSDGECPARLAIDGARRDETDDRPECVNQAVDGHLR